MENKICPLLSSGPIGINTDCKGERCAWWVPPVPHGMDGHCTMLDIRALPYIESAVRSV